ncbi:MAG: TMEM175 family protein [Chitinophagales bacterium]
MKTIYHHSKKEFQVERIVLFSDAVFAIAITLLVIDIKVPEFHTGQVNESAFLYLLLDQLPKFIGFVLSFFFIGLYWTIHHRMFGFIVNYTRKLIWLNLLFLFAIVLMPFSTALYSEYSTPQFIMLITPYAIYVGNICLIGFADYLMWRYISNPKNEIAEGFPSQDFVKKGKIRSLLLPSIFLLSLLVAIFIDPIIARFVLFLIPIAMSMVRNKKDEKQRGETLQQIQ